VSPLVTPHFRLSLALTVSRVPAAAEGASVTSDAEQIKLKTKLAVILIINNSPNNHLNKYPNKPKATVD
jgi:hypothetical protein